MHHDIQLFAEYAVTPFVGVWIETRYASSQDLPLGVTPFVGVWIETSAKANDMRAAGVTPFVGVWIETADFRTCCYCARVTPFVGVWIETLTNKRVDSYDTSHPSWVCGLKPSFGLS